MTEALITETDLQTANEAFHKQVTNQVARVTGELNRLEQLLSAGMVDRRVLSEFRFAVDRARQTGWHVEKWLDGDCRDLSAVIAEERVLCLARLANKLASELEVEGKHVKGLETLHEAVKKLDLVLAKP